MNAYIMGHLGWTKYTYFIKKAILIIYDIFIILIKNIIYVLYMIFKHVYTLSLISIGATIFIYFIKKYTSSLKIFKTE
jgi:hypothetical protein